jgi:hypothetical protein
MTGAEFATGFGEAKFIYDGITFFGATAVCALGLICMDPETRSAQTEKTRPFLVRGTGLFRYSYCNLKHSMDSGAGQITRRVPGICYRASIGVPSRQSLAKCLSGSFMQGLCKRGPCPRADHRRGLNLGGRTVSAATTVADPIGDLAALHQHFVRGRVVGLGFCHSDFLLTPANALRALSPMPAFQFKTHQPQRGCLSFSHSV